MSRNAVPILMYHQVSPQPVAAFQRYTVTPQRFAAQMRWLRLAGYTTITLDALLAQRQGRIKLPRRPVLITFDDGYQECIDYAVPILQAHHFTATFFLVAGLMGKPSEWLLPELGVTFPLIDWATARELQALGFSCGAHTMTHPHLADCDGARCRIELVEARHLLEAQLGQPVMHLAYPYGSFNAGVRALVAEAGYRSACSTQRGCSPVADDRLALQRVSVYGHDSLLAFICRLYTAYSPYELLRKRLQAGRRPRQGTEGLAIQ